MPLRDNGFAAATARGEALLETLPLAQAAHYDAASGLVRVTLKDGSSFSFPARAVQGLAKASEDVLADIEILGPGTGLHWESLDVDMSVEGLKAGRYGTLAFMQAQLLAAK